MSQLCIAHEDSFALVMQARSLVPALVIFIAESSSMLWEEDDKCFGSGSNYLWAPIPSFQLLTDTFAPRMIDNVHQAIYLLHFLAFGSENSTNVIEKTMQAPLPLYIGAIDRFIVGLGRLSYGDAPDWIDGQAKEALERSSGMRSPHQVSNRNFTMNPELARDLIECHFQGPEMDAIWGTCDQPFLFCRLHFCKPHTKLRPTQMRALLMTRNAKPERAFLRMRALKTCDGGLVIIVVYSCPLLTCLLGGRQSDRLGPAPMQPAQTAAGMSNSGSGTIQTHISSHGSHRRLNPSSSLGTLTTQGKPLATNPHTKRLDFTNERPRNLINLYKLPQRLVLILLVLFSIYQFTRSVTLPQILRHVYTIPPVSVVSPLDSMSQAYRLSRLTHLPNPVDFEPYIISPLNPVYEGDDTTACLCLGHNDTNAFIEWASKWPSRVIP